MGVITKYFVELSQPALTVSNNVYSGEFIIDAEITAEMVCGWPGSAFEVKLINLPEKKVREIKGALRPDNPLPIKIELGYFDFPFGPVIEGVVQKLKVKVEDNKLVTTLKGMETATATLNRRDVTTTLGAGDEIAGAVRRLLSEARLPAPELADVSGSVPNRVPRGKLMTVLDELARIAGVELLVMDGKVWMGRPVRRTDYLPPPKLHPDENLAVFEPFKQELPEEQPPYELERLPATEAEGFQFVATGDPKLRPGHKVLAGVDGYDELSGAEFRVASLVHKLTMSGGYTCTGYALKACTDANCRRRQGATPRLCAEDIARRLTSRVDEIQRRRPFVEVGKVKQYRPGGGSGGPGHRATLFFGQRAAATETQPSVRTPVESNNEQVFTDKPLASPFAWNKCGLVVPVYQGMKALLHHNLGLADDPVVGGFLWSEDPAIEPPASREGDYWLCLPIDFDTSQPPTASTKAVNDLQAMNGKRVLEVKGFRLRVLGSSQLPAVGVRPEEGADKELLIEHESGTFVKIAADGTLSFKASRIEIEGDVAINGNVEIT
jgi:hypothetical protein